MTKNTRRVLFYSSIAVFILLSIIVLVLALGYRYDFIKNKLVKTGSFRVKINIGADVYMNDQLVGDTSFLSDTFSKNFLLPRTYSVRVEKTDYFSWQKNVEITAGVFTDFPSVVLLPKKLKEETVSSPSFSPFSAKSGSEDKNRSYDGAKKLFFNSHEIWLEWLKDTNYQPFKKFGDKELIARFSQSIVDVQWYKDSDHLLADVGGILKFIEIDSRGVVNIYDLAVVGSKFYYNKSEDVVYKMSGRKLVRIFLK